MGFFKDIRKLNKLGKEQYMNMDVAGQVQQAQASMAQAQQLMAQQAQAAEMRVRPENGIAGTATVTAVRPTGMLVNYQPVVEVDLLVTPQGRAPYPVTVSETITVANRMSCVAGRSVPVVVDANDANVVWVDWPPA
ncbi:MAG TPA: hypothetical protein VIL36_06065 [Acidimicrobiales bacterium]